MRGNKEPRHHRRNEKKIKALRKSELHECDKKYYVMVGLFYIHIYIYVSLLFWYFDDSVWKYSILVVD